MCTPSVGQSAATWASTLASRYQSVLSSNDMSTSSCGATVASFSTLNSPYVDPITATWLRSRLPAW